MTNKYMKSSILLIIMEMQVETTVRHHFTATIRSGNNEMGKVEPCAGLMRRWNELCFHSSKGDEVIT